MWIRLVGCVLAIGLSGCVSRKEDAAVLYCASDREYAAPILDAYERANPGTEVVRQFDVEASKTLGLVTRIEQEKSQPRCDVFWNNEILHTIRLQKQGLLQPRRWSIPSDWPKGYRANDGTWIGFAARARVLLVNTEKLGVDPKGWPSRVSELADEPWKGKCGLAFPIYGTTATHMAVLATTKNALGDSKNWDSWIAEVKSNGVVLAGNKQVALAVASGELDWGLTDTDDAIIEKENGKPVALVFPDQHEGGFGTLFLPNTLAVINKAPHPIAAGSLVDYLSSEKIESRLTLSSSAHFPLWPTSKEKSRVQIDGVRWAEVDFERTADSWEQTRDRLLQVFQQ
jgi:iron(III) transport system substrate-binding protein